MVTQKESTAQRTFNIAMDDGLFYTAQKVFVGHICKQGFAYGQGQDPLGYVDDEGVIHDMQMVVFARLPATPAMMLEDLVNVMRHLHLTTLFADEFLHALARSIVKVMRVSGRLSTFRLCAKDFHLVGMVPLEMT